MGGISQKFGVPLLNLLTCNDGAVYNEQSSGSSNRVAIRGVAHTGEVVTTSTYPQEEQEIWYVAYKYSTLESVQLTELYTDIVAPSITSSYIGLLAEKPQYYIGNGTTHPSLTLRNIESSIVKYEKKSFLNVHEIPNRDHGGKLGNSTADQKHYWPGYARVKLGQIQLNTSTNRYENIMSNMSGAKLTTNYIISGSNCYNAPQIVNSNTAGLFLGENDTNYAWPAIKYFGLFQRANDEDNVYLYAAEGSSTYYYIESEPDLYLWGELTENNNWYHPWTYVATEWDTKRSSLYELIDEVYVLTSDTVYDSSKTYYEKTGIIVNPDEGAAFSIGSFKMIFENNGF